MDIFALSYCWTLSIFCQCWLHDIAEFSFFDNFRVSGTTVAEKIALEKQVAEMPKNNWNQNWFENQFLESLRSLLDRWCFKCMLFFLETLGRPMVVIRVWKSFVATNPDALYNSGWILHTLAEYRLNTSGTGPALLQLPCTALDLPVWHCKMQTTGSA